MPLRIRFARGGVRNDHFFRIVAQDAKRRRNARPVDTMGIYTPRPMMHVQRPSLIDLVQTVSAPHSQVIEDKLANGFAEGGEREVRKDVRWNVDRLRYWIGVGAQPTPAVLKLMRTGGFLNNHRDLEVLRTQTSKKGSQPDSIHVRVAASKRGPKGVMSRYRKRGLLPAETEILDDGSIKIPASVTKTGEELHLSADEVKERLRKATLLLSVNPSAILPPRHPQPLLRDDGRPSKRRKRDPSWWKRLRRARAASQGLLESERIDSLISEKRQSGDSAVGSSQP